MKRTRYFCARCFSPDAVDIPEGLCEDCTFFTEERLTNNAGSTMAKTHTLDQLDRPENNEQQGRYF